MFASFSSVSAWASCGETFMPLMVQLICFVIIVPTAFLRQAAGCGDERISTLLHTPPLEKFAERVSTF